MDGKVGSVVRVISMSRVTRAEALPIVSSTGMCHGNEFVLRHFTLKLLMQKASFTFIMSIQFIPCFMALAGHDNNPKAFRTAMSNMEPSIKPRPWKSFICIYT